MSWPITLDSLPGKSLLSLPFPGWTYIIPKGWRNRWRKPSLHGIVPSGLSTSQQICIFRTNSQTVSAYLNNLSSKTNKTICQWREKRDGELNICSTVYLLLGKVFQLFNYSNFTWSVQQNTNKRYNMMNTMFIVMGIVSLCSIHRRQANFHCGSHRFPRLSGYRCQIFWGYQMRYRREVGLKESGWKKKKRIAQMNARCLKDYT